VPPRSHAIPPPLAPPRDDWDVVLSHTLAAAFGLQANATPLARLARLVPLNIVKRHLDSDIQIAALYFGCAGLLNRIFTDAYPIRLQKEFHHLSAKYDLSAIDARAWNWGRLRPANFPSVRIAQFAALLPTLHSLFHAVIESQPKSVLRSLLSPRVDSYWNTHSDFDRPVRQTSRQLGNHSVDNILINAVVPFLYCYGRRHADEHKMQNAIDLLSEFPPEDNTITRKWEGLEMPNTHAGQSQGLLFLKKNYCNHRHCVNCGIGNHILTATPSAL
jgi:hypothetical protein